MNFVGKNFCVHLCELEINSGDVLLSLRNCLLKLGIDDDDDFDLEDLKGKITERTSMNLTKENFKKFYSDFQ